MTNQITFYDTTMRDGEQTIGVNFTIDEKIKLAQALEKYGVSAIEAGFPAASEKDFDAVVEISKVVHTAKVVGLARLVRQDIDAVVAATQQAKHPMIHVFIATSPVHRTYKLHMSPSEIIEKVISDIRYTKTMMSEIIFSPEDATRTEPEFLARVIQAAIESGATMINIPDTVGYATPYEYGELFEYLREHVRDFDQVTWAIHTHNDLGMANANALAGIMHGATEIQGTINGIGERAGNVDIIEAAAAIYVRRQTFAKQTAIILEQSKHISDIVAQATHMPVAKNKPIMGRNAFAHESGIHQDGYLKNPETYEILRPEMVGTQASLPLGKLSGSHAVMNQLLSLGYQISRQDMVTILPIFKRIAEKTSTVSDQQMQDMMTMIQTNKMMGAIHE
ncbi:2-isopropylmalate synthase [Leuconostoc citreum]|uniref:2-isopropylmalate synthase n=1 Tax=Leuconostoc citreum TaxID=33964 RepID=UPI0020A082A1|nr:2-isopropylmalate synthase [Leuconostoc citreum]MCP1276755.1 2-isopropylmalate synthase [Leuconostoc citreum]